MITAWPQSCPSSKHKVDAKMRGNRTSHQSRDCSLSLSSFPSLESWFSSLVRDVERMQKKIDKQLLLLLSFFLKKILLFHDHPLAFFRTCYFLL